MNFQFLAGSPWKSKKDASYTPSNINNLFKSPRSKSQNNSDRFIPCRIHDSIASLLMQTPEESSQALAAGTSNTSNSLPKEEQGGFHNHYSALLEAQIILDFDTTIPEHKEKFPTNTSTPLYKPTKNMLKYKKFRRSISENIMTGYTPFQGNSFESAKTLTALRKISKLPYKILDAPSLVDDYYLNLLDWSSTNNVSIGLDGTVYVWSASTNKAYKVHEAQNNCTISSVSWNEASNYLAVGESDGRIKVYDVEACKVVHSLGGHSCRAGSIAWSGNQIASGSRDRSILVRDVRTNDHHITKYVGHKQEICGLKWSPDQKYLASGGNDNKIIVWNGRTQGEMTRFTEHQAAVKALAWNPEAPNILASGGGKSDRCIKFWNMHTNKKISSIDTGSQVCNMMFSKNSNELVTTHGYSLNEIIVWNYPTMEKVASLTGHSSRVLYLGMSPDGENIVTGAGDETLRFWNVFPPHSKTNADIFDHSAVFPSSIDLR